MKKRLRKKKHFDEFAEWGCHLIVTRNTKMKAEAFQDTFILEAIENNGCYCGGSFYDDKIDIIVDLGKKSENIESKFAKVTAWLDARPDIEGWKSGQLVDIWYGDFD